MGETTGHSFNREIPTRVLVLGLARHDGSILASEVAQVADACGHSPEQVRSCLRRLVAEGLFERQGVGRAALYQPTEAGLNALGTLASRTRLAYVQDRMGRGWDGRWHIAAFAVPESRRTARDKLREKLGWLGGAAVHSGFYVSAHPWDKDVMGEAERLDIAQYVSLASSDDLTIGGETNPLKLAERLWRINELADAYASFVEQWSVVADELEQRRDRHERLAEVDFLAGALAMGVAFEECFSRDPVLPPELLPRPWPGRQARELVARSRRLGLQIRSEHNKPALFRAFDDVMEGLP